MHWVKRLHSSLRYFIHCTMRLLSFSWYFFCMRVIISFLSFIAGKFERSNCTMGVHITHNGDFDEMEAYQQVHLFPHIFSLTVVQCVTRANVDFSSLFLTTRLTLSFCCLLFL